MTHDTPPGSSQHQRWAAVRQGRPGATPGCRSSGWVCSSGIPTRTASRIRATRSLATCGSNCVGARPFMPLSGIWSLRPCPRPDGID